MKYKFKTRRTRIKEGFFRRTHAPQTKGEIRNAGRNLTIGQLNRLLTFKRRRREAERKALHIPVSTMHEEGESRGAAYSRHLREKGI
ncbi:MAG TPA: hypothetical protein VEP90_12580 [Methylomirabilota bacterium]|nr:hypothetical protein [Methylomirabilota bacterium]